MTPEHEALALRAVACEGFRWTPGMLTTEDYRVIETWRDTAKVAKGTLVYNLAQRGDGWAWDWFDPSTGCFEEDDSGALLPDLSDPATLGCLLALVRVAWGGEIVVRVGRGWWEIECEGYLWEHENTASFAAALVAALEAAP